MALYQSQRSFAEVAHLDAYCPLLPDLATIVTRVCAQGDQAGRPQHPSAFDTAVPAPLSIQDYMIRLCKHGFCSQAVWVAACGLLDRWSELTGRMITSHNVHKLMFTGFVLAAKIRDDSFYSMQYYSKMGGVPTSELVQLEKIFLRDLHFCIDFSADHYNEWVRRLSHNNPSPAGAA
eukprot:TRINITY_DN50758_c0_g1_i1.p2 TRINITY_DN50758_c0_g1~~TRINITY_DN50758_c0_g1_i1.p2  ORF type:complete len:177 (+),score=52.12 TRINITY_DN50758_c0_g1_i1:111-641(+)